MDIFSSLVHSALRWLWLPPYSMVRLSSWTLVYGTARVSGRLFLRRLKWGAGMLACVASIFALNVMILRAEDAFGNGFEVFDCYEIGSVFAF
ncbi:Uncharacterised protein [Mycobacterium tuberculosis]|nr:Uncharacterised protein [Mycobacterium tuberculosis]